MTKPLLSLPDTQLISKNQEKRVFSVSCATLPNPMVFFGRLRILLTVLLKPRSNPHGVHEKCPRNENLAKPSNLLTRLDHCIGNIDRFDDFLVI